MLDSSPEERGSHLLRGGSLKSLKGMEVHIIHTLLFVLKNLLRRKYVQHVRGQVTKLLP
jgi:hypothetical protein